MKPELCMLLTRSYLQNICQSLCRRTGQTRVHTDKVNHPENPPFLGSHGKVTALSVAFHWMKLRGCNQCIIHFARGSQLRIRCIGGEREDENNNNNDHSVHVVGDKCCFDPAEKCIEHDTYWE